MMVPECPKILSEAVAQSSDFKLVDIRPRTERYHSVGFIPGSRSFPTQDFLDDPAKFRQQYNPTDAIVLYCLTGNRSCHAVAKFNERGFRNVYSLDGGILAWQGGMFPVCGVNPVTPDTVPTVNNLQNFPRVLVSCFYAEIIEKALDQQTTVDVDAHSLITTLIEEEQKFRQSSTIDLYVQVLDRLAEIAKKLGHPLEKIAMNVDRMMAALDSFAQGQ